MNKTIAQFHELNKIHKLAQFEHSLVKSRTLAEVEYKDTLYPIISFEIGSSDPKAPTIGLFGGVHGLEKIGTHVIVAYLNTLFKQLAWDKDLREILESTRIVSIPLINPVGMAYNFRSNARGVDLMRNAPVNSEEKNSPLLLSGHRLGPFLPWYRGTPEIEMELESRILCDYVQEQMFCSETSIALDFHSGFGMRDRLWYPYAKSKKPFPRIQEVRAIKSLLDQTLPHHIYKIEAQSNNYTTHGDLWDYLFMNFEESYDRDKNVFLPWTLEMGSWLWLKKNPGQGFSAEGFFNPIKEHRMQRTMRRHILLINFLLNIVRNKSSWTPPKT